MAEVAPGHDRCVGDVAAPGAGRRELQPDPYPARLDRRLRGSTRRRAAVLARRRTRELQEDVVERRAAQANVADADLRLAQGGRGALDQFQAVARGGEHESVRALVRLGIPAADCDECRARALAISDV